MYHDIIYDFQHSLYNLFINDEGISSKIDGVYLSVVQDAKYPFLLINILNIDNMSVLWQNIAKIDFEICIFTNDKNRNVSFELAQGVTNKINTHSFELTSSALAGIKVINVMLQNSKDLISTKLTIIYQALLKQKIT
jgi:hypothetical protein